MEFGEPRLHRQINCTRKFNAQGTLKLKVLLKSIFYIDSVTHQVWVERRRVDARVRVLVGGRVWRVHGRGGRRAPVAGVVRRQRRGCGQLARAHGYGGLGTSAVARSGGGTARAAAGGAHNVG